MVGAARDSPTRSPVRSQRALKLSGVLPGEGRACVCGLKSARTGASALVVAPGTVPGSYDPSPQMRE